MNLQSATQAGTSRHRAEDDLFLSTGPGLPRPQSATLACSGRKHPLSIGCSARARDGSSAIAASRPVPQRRVTGRQSGNGKLNEVDQLMGERRNWQLLPFIIIAGLLVGWVSGQLVSLIPPQDGPTAERPKMSPR
jgi:hypothetical protein